MNKWIMTALAIAATGTIQAKQLDKTDDNTLWMEDGKEIVLSPKSMSKCWRVIPGKKDLEIKSNEAGKGFRFYAKDGSGRYTVTSVKISPEYPYLTFRITNIEMLNGYRNWTVLFNGFFSCAQVTSPQKGIYIFDMYQNLPEKAFNMKAAYLNFTLYNLGLDFDYIKLVKKPDYVVRAECADTEIKPGSKVKFTAELVKEAEDVSITLTTAGQPRPVKLNGVLKIQLKPTDKTQKVWTTEIEVKSIGIAKALKRRHNLFMKMDVLGGDLDEPVWVGLPYPVAP